LARLSVPNTPQHFLIATILNTKSSRWTLLAWLSIQVPINDTVTAHGAQRSTRAKGQGLAKRYCIDSAHHNHELKNVSHLSSPKTLLI
jgi:hypothetical protein